MPICSLSDIGKTCSGNCNEERSRCCGCTREPLSSHHELRPVESRSQLPGAPGVAAHVHYFPPGEFLHASLLRHGAAATHGIAAVRSGDTATSAPGVA